MPSCRRPLFAAGLLLAATAAGPACAADVAAPAGDPWTSLYLGAQFGYVDGTGSGTDLCDAAAGLGTYCFGAEDGVRFGDNSTAGGSLGGYLGFNYQIESIVLGLEGDLNWDGAQGSNSLGNGLGYDSALNWDASVRARLGYVVGERAMLYVTGGPSWINAEVDSGAFCTATSWLQLFSR